MDYLDRSWVKNLLAEYQAGLDHYTKTETNTHIILTFYFIGGQTCDLTFEKPTSIIALNSIKIENINVSGTQETHITYELTDGTKKDAGKLPNIHNHANKEVLDKFSYDDVNNKLLYDNKPISANDTEIVVKEITTPSTTWNVQHNLGTKYPSIVAIIDDSGNLHEGFPNYANSTNNLLIIKFINPIKGKIIVKK